jgi:hypothetical protein
MARKRNRIQPHAGDKRFIRRSKTGRFTENQVEVGRSLNKDNDRRAKRTVQKGQGDRGDQKR